MTQLTITPKIADKTARFKGTIAAGEHVAVIIKGGAGWLGEDGDRSPVLRVIDCTTRRTLAVFPYWTEDNSEDWPDGLESPDAWETSGDDNADLSCTLNLNTLRMVAAARHMLRVPVMFVLGDTDDPRTLYFRDRYEVEYWPERIGDTVPYDLDKWPKQIDEWTELVAGWTARLNGLKLEAERTEAVGTTPGKTKITLNDGTAEEDAVVEILDGQVSADQLASAVSELEDAIADKQDALTFDDAPTANSANPVKSGGVKNAIDTVATNLSTHTNNSGIHVTADQKSAWTAKYAKPSGGIPASDLAGEIGKAKLTSSVQGSLDKADTAVQPGALSAYVNDASYDSTEKKILFKHGSTTIAYIDATAFIKDGMVSSVAISNGYLVITFNTDAGTSPISIALTDIFNPANYYDKTAADGRFVQKETGKGLVAVDATLATQGAAADAKAVGDALRSGFTEWEFSGVPDGITVESINYDSLNLEWELVLSDGNMFTNGGSSDTLLVFSSILHSITATRHLITPTKTSQLTNDGDGTNAFVKTNDARLSDARTPTAHTHAIADVTGLGAALAQKANASDLPYALVALTTPTEWVFSGVEEWFEITSGPDYDADQQGWYLSVASVPQGWIDDIFVSGASDATSLTFTVSDRDGEENDATVVATKTGYALLDRAGNRVVVTGDTTLTLPAAVPGYLRDFLVRLEISGSTVPTITFSPDGNESVTYETDGDEFPVPDEAGDWLYSFTESCVAHKFAVALKKVNEVAAPQAQGGS